MVTFIEKAWICNPLVVSLKAHEGQAGDAEEPRRLGLLIWPCFPVHQVFCYAPSPDSSRTSVTICFIVAVVLFTVLNIVV